MTEATKAPWIETVWFVEATYAPDAAETRVREMCEKLLANPVIESYAVELLP